MKTKTMLVVGNIFSNFAEMHEMVITFDTFFETLDTEFVDQFYLRIGQGISNTELNEIVQAIAASKHKGKFIFNDTKLLAYQDDAEHQRKVHKHYSSNVMISPPLNLGASCFTSELHLQSDCEELGDHTTGQHIQGMILVEAARQMMLSVSENYLLKDGIKGNAYFVLHNINIAFKNFMFPANADIRFIASNIEHKKSGSMHAESMTTFFQNGIEMAEVSIDFTAYDQNYIAAKENAMAEATCDVIAETCETEQELKYA